MKANTRSILVPLFAMLVANALPCRAAGLILEGGSGPGSGKHIVLISGDEEYRSEESCPMLAKIFSKRLGFRTTVLFAIHPDGFIDPNYQRNIPGMEALADADLVIIGTRFRDLPDEQLQPFADYLNSGKPVIGFRTATHAFKTKSMLGGINWNAFGPEILGEGWVSHYGNHKVQGARGVINPPHATHPILRGVGRIFAESDVYTVNRATDGNATILVHGVVTASLLQDSPDVPGKVPQPAAWLRQYKTPDGSKEGTAFCTTFGAASDLDDENLRRLIINAAMHLCGIEVPEKTDVSLVDPFVPSAYGFNMQSGYYKQLDLKPSDYGWGKSPQTGPKFETLVP